MLVSELEKSAERIMSRAKIPNRIEISNEFNVVSFGYE